MRSTPDRIGLAERLLELAAAELAATSAARSDRDPAALVCDRLGAVLTTFAGASGSRALLSRALALAALEAPALAAVEIGADGTTSGFDSLDGDTKHAAGLVLVGRLLELLTELIGEALLRRLAAKAWPDANGFIREQGTENTA